MARSTSNIDEIARINRIMMQLQTGADVTLVLTDGTRRTGIVKSETSSTSWSSIPPKASGEVQLVDQQDKQHVLDMLGIERVIRREQPP